MRLLPEACALPIRHAPDQGGRRLFSPGLYGFGLGGPKNWILANGLGLGVLGSDLSVLGLDLRLHISQIYSEKVSGSLAFRVRYFLIIGLSLRAPDRECLQFAPLIFQKLSFEI